MLMIFAFAFIIILFSCLKLEAYTEMIHVDNLAALSVRDMEYPWLVSSNILEPR